MKVYFVRHGQTADWNSGLHQSSHSQLSEKGREQAQFLTQRFKDIAIDKIITSPFARAKQTAEIVNQVLNVSLEEEPLVVEIKRPTEVEGKPHNDPEIKRIMNLVREDITDKDFRYADEENLTDLSTRAANALKRIESEQLTNLLVVTHGAFLKNMVMEMLLPGQADLNLFKALGAKFAMENTGVTVCEYKNNTWYLLTWSDYAHLPE